MISLLAGCGVNFLSRSLFFTKNGELLGIAVQKLRHCRKFYPIVTLHSTGARVRLNFSGHRCPFVFAVGEYIQQLDEAFRGTRLSRVPFSTDDTSPP